MRAGAGAAGHTGAAAGTGGCAGCGRTAGPQAAAAPSASDKAIMTVQVRMPMPLLRSE